MTVAYIMDGGLFDGPGTGLDLHEQFASVRELYEQVEQWSGLEPGRLCRWELPRLHEYRQVGAIRQAAVALGVCDLLAERGLRPDVTTGVSLGGMVAACTTGAVERRELFALLGHLRHAPEPSGPAEGGAALFIPAGVEHQEYLGRLVDGVYVAVDCGSSGEGGQHTYLLSGYAEALQEVAGRLPEGALYVLPEITVAFHSPLSNYLVDYLAPFINQMPFRAPQIPLGSCMGPGLLVSADDVREMFLHNQTRMVSLPHMFANLVGQDTDLAALVGPGNVERFPGGLPFPVIHVETAEQLEEGLATIFELGIPFALGI
ncbi:hypothetical protein Drose_26820 [Dactylosporangium roseum]|uniref:[acyl-carrier-protein] S-malonyltransferase n=1 Tax=Dactylosporangium roseum TaxID=47989 RepID=A0ABY5Z210_9ACTN|nr:hypothetical protein [Dactylosporangium roseum]UWZ34788.1 hypothetical protein Drose_26820 [Dactylosporangium roseum]